MMTLRKFIGLGSALLLAAVVSHCDSSGTGGTNVDNGDMAMPDLMALAPPVITSVAPGNVSNAGGVLITITGTGFQPGATVTVAGVACTNPTVVSATTITCTTGATATPVCGPTAVTVSNPDKQSASNNSALVLKSKALGFGNPANIPNALNDPNSKQAVTADLDADGKMDVANLDEVAGGAGVVPKVSIHLGKGDGTFIPTTTISLAANSNPTALAVADVTGDGKLDLVVTLGQTQQVQVLSGDGKGGFTPQTAVALTVASPVSLGLGDVKGV